ncbi:MAG: hypothetical protein WAU49_03845, partial [Steroidobacteraceae bacterium]
MRRVSPVVSPCRSNAAITSFTLESPKSGFAGCCAAVREALCGAGIGFAAPGAAGVTAAGAVALT